MARTHDQAIAAQLRQELEATAPAGSEVEVEVSDLGGIHVVVRRPDARVIVMQGRADGSEYGVTPDLPLDAGFNDGHPIVIGSFGEARSVLLEAIR
jgi:hypothetical protein